MTTVLTDDDFRVPGEAPGALSLVFSDRSPDDRRLPVREYVARIIGPEIDARIGVSGWEEGYSPVLMFNALAKSWRGWDGEIVWESLEGELSLRVTQNRSGHVWITVDLWPGRDDTPFSARASIETTAGGLDRLASEASAFFGPCRP